MKNNLCIERNDRKMKFVKRIMIGTAITATAYMMYSEGMLNKKKMMKQARRWANKMGIEC